MGSAYGLVAIGFVVIFRVTRTINLAQGEFAALAGMLSVAAVAAGVPILVALPLCVLAVTALAVGTHATVIAPLSRLDTLTSLILTLGVATALKAVMLIVWGPDSRALAPFPGGDLHVAGVTVKAQELWLLAVMVVLAVAVWWFQERTLWGRALTACAEQPVAARLVGISVRRAGAAAFALAGATAAIAGIVSSPLYFSSWETGLTMGLKGFVAAAVAGLVSVRAAVVGGVAIGVLESLVAGYWSTGLREAAAFVVLIAILLVRPRGVFGATTVERV